MHDTAPTPRWLQWLTATAFVAALALPGLLGLATEDLEESTAEKRDLAGFPRLREPADLESFPAGFDAYWSDHFGGREPLTRAFRTLKFAMGDSPADGVIRGRDGWLFLGSMKPGSDRYDGVTADARHADRYTPEQLDRAVEALAARRDWLAQRDAAYVLVLVPNKHTVYPNKLPRWFDRVHPESAADQLVGALRARTRVEVLDLRPVLAAARLDGPVYFERDTHWNARGAGVAADALTGALNRVLPNEFGRVSWTLAGRERRVGDLTRLTGVALPPEPAPEPVFGPGVAEPVRDPARGSHKQPHRFRAAGPFHRAVVFNDSFFEAVEPHAARLFAESLYLFERPSAARLRAVVEEERPDVVIEQWAERKLPWVPPAEG